MASTVAVEAINDYEDEEAIELLEDGFVDAMPDSYATQSSSKLRRAVTSVEEREAMAAVIKWMQKNRGQHFTVDVLHRCGWEASQSLRIQLERFSPQLTTYGDPKKLEYKTPYPYIFDTNSLVSWMTLTGKPFVVERNVIPWLSYEADVEKLRKNNVVILIMNDDDPGQKYPTVRLLPQGISPELFDQSTPTGEKLRSTKDDIIAMFKQLALGAPDELARIERLEKLAAEINGEEKEKEVKL